MCPSRAFGSIKSWNQKVKEIALFAPHKRA